MTGKANAPTDRQILAVVRKLGRKNNPKTDRKTVSGYADERYHDGWTDACQEIESKLMEFFGGKA